MSEDAVRLVVMQDEVQVLTLVRSDHPEDQGDMIAITDAEIEDLRRVEREFLAWQSILAERSGTDVPFLWKLVPQG
jgi:hypothetical protein